MSIRTLTDLVKTRLSGDWWQVYTGEVPSDPPSGYVTIYPSPGNATSENLADSQNRLRWTVRLVCSGYGSEQAMDVADATRNLMTRWQPYPNDPSASRFREVDEDAPLLPDRTVPGDIRFSLTLVYRLYTNRS